MSQRHNYVLLTLLALLVLCGATGCNKSTQDPGQADAQVAVASVVPLAACVDYDGTWVDENRDGTFQEAERAYVSTTNMITLQSRVRGSATGGNSTWSDVIFSQVEIDYAFTSDGFAPPKRLDRISVTVPAGGTSDIIMTTVLATDIATRTYFGAGTRGNILLTFRGVDAGNQPVIAHGQIPIESVSVCAIQ